MNNILHSESFVVSGRYIYFSDTELNGLYRSSLNDWSVDFLGFFPKEKLNETGLHGRSFIEENTVFFSPKNALCFHTYNIKENAFGTYNIVNGCTKRDKYLGMTLCCNKLVLFPYNSDEVLLIDSLERMQLTKSPEDDLINRIKTDMRVSHAVGTVGKYVYAATTEDRNCIIQIDTTDNQMRIVGIENCIEGFENL